MPERSDAPNRKRTHAAHTRSVRARVALAILAALSLALATGCLPRSWTNWTARSESGSSADSEP